MNYFDDMQCIQVRRTVSNQSSAPHVNKEFWGIGLMLGSGQVQCITSSGEGKILSMPFLYLIRPSGTGNATCWIPVNQCTRENCWFIVQGERSIRLVRSLEQYCQNETGSLQLPDYTQLIAIHKKMLHLYQHGLPAHAYRLSLCVEEFAAAFYDTLSGSSKKSPIQHLAEQTAKQITLAPGNNFDFEAIAAKHKVSYDHFRRIFRQYTGQALHSFLLEKRLFLGRDLLQQSSFSIKEISEKCGFPRQAEFARFIRQKCGCSPSNLRKKPEMDLL